MRKFCQWLRESSKVPNGAILLTWFGCALLIISLMVSCTVAPGFDPAPLTKQVQQAQAIAQAAQTVADKAKQAADQSNAGIAAIQKQLPAFTTHDYVNKAVSATAQLPLEFIALKGQVNSALAAVTSLTRDQTQLRSDVQASITRFQDSIQKSLATQYMTQGDRLALESRIAALEARVSALEKKLTEHGW